MFSLDNPLMGIICLASLILFSYVALAYGVPAVDSWEATRNYPFGKICDLYNVCK